MKQEREGLRRRKRSKDGREWWEGEGRGWEERNEWWMGVREMMKWCVWMEEEEEEEEEGEKEGACENVCEWSLHHPSSPLLPLSPLPPPSPPPPTLSVYQTMHV